MSKRNPRYANGNARRKAVARLKAEHRGCWICRAFGRDDRIDYDLPAGHPFSFECDEITPVSYGRTWAEQVKLATDPSNLDATHRVCNQWRRNRSKVEILVLAAHNRPRPKMLEQPLEF